MSLERHDYSEAECNNDANSTYIAAYMGWITPQVKGVVCDIGSGLGYPTLDYAKSELTEKIYTNDKFFDEVKTTTHPKIQRFVENTEDFIKRTDLPKFDTITSTEHIEHLTADVQFDVLDFVVNNLKEDGVFFGSMPDAEHSGNPYHLKEYRYFQWEEILQDYFDKVQVYPIIPNLLYVWMASEPKKDKIKK